MNVVHERVTITGAVTMPAPDLLPGGRVVWVLSASECTVCPFPSTGSLVAENILNTSAS